MPNATRNFDPDVVLFNVSEPNLDLVRSGVIECFQIEPSEVYRPDWDSTGLALTTRRLSQDGYRPLILIDAGEKLIRDRAQYCIDYLMNVLCLGIRDRDYLIVILLNGKDTILQRKMKETDLKFDILNLGPNKGDVQKFAEQLDQVWRNFKNPRPSLFARIFGEESLY